MPRELPESFTPIPAQTVLLRKENNPRALNELYYYHATPGERALAIRRVFDIYPTGEQIAIRIGTEGQTCTVERDHVLFFVDPLDPVALW